MRSFLFGIFFLLSSTLAKSQTPCPYVLAYDNMETYTWFGDWLIPGSTWGFYTNAFVSSNVSAAIYGTGTASSAYEAATYDLPNLSGLNPLDTHVIRFRLASYRITSTGTTSGTDVGDYITLRLSTNGGVSYTNEMRITGFSNSYWTYSSTAVASKIANGVLTTYSPAAGGNRTSTGDGYSYIELKIPPGPTNIAARIDCRANATGEEWWIDNIELWDLADCTPLPIELLYFKGKSMYGYNLLEWSSATEHNNLKYVIERSFDGYNWQFATEVMGAGNSTSSLIYTARDYLYNRGVTYYRLTQYDFDGQSKTFDIIAVDNSTEEVGVIKRFNMMGQEVDEFYRGHVIEILENGQIRRCVR